MTSRSSSILDRASRLVLVSVLVSCRTTLAFPVVSGGSTTRSSSAFRSTASDTDTDNDTAVANLKSDLLSLAESTNRGFDASASQRRRAKDLVDELSRYNPTDEPAAAYYDNNDNSSNSGPTLAGKWTLVYTDAPDITTLGSTPTANLGRIGQECDSSRNKIANVIEWTPPDWTPAFLKRDRILQKVRCGAAASPDDPSRVKLTIEGLALEQGGNDDDDDLPFLPLELKGFLSLPFGEFRVLYLDDEIRAVRTSQGYLAVNVRGKEWF